ncbi:MAG: lipopolysaccharide heptosyltransferase II [Candidatus Omnitrophica bacterium]|nr:lipopolysaccharide heptosyltransferase II [Candidatus Omnitrophota bacterium]
MKALNREKIKKILVVRTDRMGDVLLNVPAIRALKASFKATIVMLADAGLKDLLQGIEEIDAILPFEEGKWHKSISWRLSLLRQIRQERFSLAVMLNPSRRFHILSYMARIPLRLGYDRKWSFLLTHKIKDNKYEGKKHEVEYNLDLVRSIGADTDDKKININIDKEDARFVQGLLEKNAIGDKDPLVAIQPNSSNPAKCWPRENFAQVADELYQRFSTQVAIIGAGEDRGSAIKLISLTKHQPINLCGNLTLRQLAAFLRRCTLLISNDSGPVHIAAAVNTATCVIFGRNIPGVSPRRWGPWGNSNIALHKDPGCNPCLDRNCPYGFKCLKSITPREVLEAAEKQLESR